MAQSKKTLEFLQKLKDKGHWNDDYDYSEVNYTGSKNRVVIINKSNKIRHLMRPYALLSGSKLVIENAIDKNKFALYLYRKIHRDTYDYPFFEYVNAKSKINVRCKKHGLFQISHNKHALGGGCPDCSKKEKGRKRKLNVNDVLMSFRETHGDKFDYSEFKYISATTKSKIICRVHGVFEQTPDKHRSGRGCPKCRGLGLTNEERVENLIKANGKTYDYSLVDYKKSNQPIKIICRVHGVFFQTYNNHLRGRGCPECKGIKSYNSESIVEEFKKVHGNLYDYSLVNYKNTQEKIKIICAEHGIFEQSAAQHKAGQNCPKCGGRGMTTEEVIVEFKKVHGDKYDYSLVNFKLKKIPVKIICKEHGVFQQKPINHILGKGCPKCSGGVLLKQQYVISQFKQVHGEKYDYSLVEYNSTNKKVKIICRTHGIFEQGPAQHKTGSGCPICNSGWNTDRIIGFINDIKNEDVLKMDPVELNMLIAQGKLPKEFEELVFTLEGTKENSLKTLKEKLGIEENAEINEDRALELYNELDQIISSEENLKTDSISAAIDQNIEEVEHSSLHQGKSKSLPSISNDDILVLDKELIGTCDDEAVEFFIQYKLRKVWNEVINDKRQVKDLKDLNGGKNSSRLRDLFLEEYQSVLDYSPPKGYAFPYQPNMMQKLTVSRVKNYKRYGNWSGTGAGKTISFIVASREIDSRLTLVICLNSTVSQLEEDILEVYPDSVVHASFKKGQKFDRTKYNYLLLNYEKFQQGYTEEIFQDLNENNRVDFIVLDEVHNSKQRDKNESQRRGALMRLIGRSAEMNSDFYLLGMSATPVINNLIEAKSLLQLITGKQYDDINTRGSISNALKVFNQLLLNGVRYIPKYEIVLKESTGENTPTLNIDGSDLTEKLKDNDNKDYLGLEKILLEGKIPVLRRYLKPKTIIYSYFTDGDRIPKRIAKDVRALGYTTSMYIGEQSPEEREKSKLSFVKGSTDILIASRTIGTGVDGLQSVCNRMILMTLPWTDSEYTQLKGRIYRQGSKFGDVEIIIPQVYVDLEDKRWSWDKQRLQLIREKRTLADAAVDGIIPSKHIPSRQKLCSDSLKALRSWKERVNEGKITSIDRKDLVLPLRPEIVEYLRPQLGDFSEMNKTWSTARSDNTNKRLKKDPSEWYYYHSLYKNRRKDWDEIPYIEISKKIKARPEWVVADMGCGENLLSEEVENKVHAFDYVAINDSVTACDMSKVPLEGESVDAAIFCLSLMGSNYIDYIQESHRIMKPLGHLFICEPKKKVEKRMEALIAEIENVGFKVVSTKTSSQFIYIQAIKL